MTSLSAEPIQLSNNFYQLGTPFFPVYLSLGEKAVLIEGGTSGTFDIIVAQLAALNIDPATIAYIALTHSHADHIGAYPRIRARWPHVKIVAGKAAARMLGNENVIKQFHWLDQKIAQAMQAGGDITAPPAPLDDWNFDIDMIVKEGDVIDLGRGVRWTVYEIPGHAPCHLAFLEESQAIMAIGDATGFYNPEKDGLWPNYFDGLDIYCDSIKKLARLPAQSLVLSHNGYQSNAREYLAKALRTTGNYHREMLERGGNGESLDDIIADKSQWIKDIADRMPMKIITQLSGLLIKLSQKAGPKPPEYFTL